MPRVADDPPPIDDTIVVVTRFVPSLRMILKLSVVAVAP
jgi:hypothetical protein